jgi:hypothetical protein
LVISKNVSGDKNWIREPETAALSGFNEKNIMI